jgi:hypothetical protein
LGFSPFKTIGKQLDLSKNESIGLGFNPFKKEKMAKNGSIGLGFSPIFKF